MDQFQQPEDRLGQEPQDAVVDGQVQVGRQRLEVFLDLRTGVEGHRGGALAAGRHAQCVAGEADDVVALAVLAAFHVVGAVGGGNPGGDEVVLQPGDPAARYGLLQALVVQIAHGNFLVVLLGGPDRRTQVGGRGGGGRRRIGAAITLELRVGGAVPGLVALVVDQVLDLEVVGAALEGEALDVADALIGVAQIDDQLLLTVGQLVLARFAAPAGTTGAAVRRDVADQAALCHVGAAAAVVEQLERHLGILLMARVFRQAQLHDIAADRVDGQLQHVGADADQLIAAGGIGHLAGLRLGLLGHGHVVVERAGLRIRQIADGVAGNVILCRRQGRLAVVLIPLQNQQIGDDCQGDEQYRTFDIHGYSAIEGGRGVEAGGTGS